MQRILHTLRCGMFDELGKGLLVQHAGSRRPLILKPMIGIHSLKISARVVALAVVQVASSLP